MTHTFRYNKRVSAVREFARYQMAMTDVLVARPAIDRGQFRFITLSEGGCAFLGNDPEMQLVPPARLEIEFVSVADSSAFKVWAELLYVRPYDMRNNMMLYGFRFLVPDRKRFSSVLQSLEQLVQQGQLDYA